MSRLTRDGTAENVSRDQILRHERGQGNIHADHEQDWQPFTRLIHTLAICVTIQVCTNTITSERIGLGAFRFFFKKIPAQQVFDFFL